MWVRINNSDMGARYAAQPIEVPGYLALRDRIVYELLAADPYGCGSGVECWGGPGWIDVTVDGHGAYRLEEITVVGPCAGSFVLHADVDHDGRLSSADREVARGDLGSSSSLSAYP